MTTGAYAITATAFDNQGASTVSTPINISVGTNAGAPSFAAAGSALDSESGPVNGGLDPGETVTLRFSIKNTGLGDTANLTATLQTSGGVTFPTSAQNYGVLTTHGAAVGKSFTFTAFGSSGGTITATLALQDGTNSYGNLTDVFTMGGTTNYANLGVIINNDNTNASPFPSTIGFSGLTGLVSKVSLTISNLSHTSPSDIDMLLVSPDGQKVMFMSDAGGSTPVTSLSPIHE